MRPGWFVSVMSLVLALLLHAAVLVLLLVSFSFTPELKPAKEVSIVSAVTVDKAKVEEEVRRLKQKDEKKQQQVAELEKQLEAEKKKTEEIKNRRLEEEKQYLETKQKKEEEQKKHEEMQHKVAELEQQRKLEEEKKARAETEMKKLEEEKKAKAAAEKKKKDAELKKKEEEKKREEAEKAMLEQIEEEEKKAQGDADRKLASELGNEIHDKIARYFNLTGLPDNLSCKLRVNMLPSGEVTGVAILESSGNSVFDQRALTAVQKASPLPVPQDAETFERLNLRDSTFTFKP